MAPEIQLRKHDILMTKDGTIGKVLFVDEIPYPGKASLNSHLLLFRPILKSYCPRYLYYQLQSRKFNYFMNLNKSGTTFFGISQGAVGNYTVLMPPMKRQEYVAAILSDMDADITELEAKLAKARKVKQGMMQELLTGRIRLPLVQKCVTQAKTAKKPKHNQHFEDAVIIGTLVDMFGRGQFPLGRKRYTKLSYLLHRFQEQDTSAYLKKAAGPYNPTTRYGGAEKISIKNQYVRQAEAQYKSQYKGFVPGENAGQAQEYFLKWYGPEALQWLEQFRYAKTDDLELWATIDAAIQDVRAEGQAETLENVKAVLQGNKEWVKKLDRPVFSDLNIMRALQKVNELFAK